MVRVTEQKYKPRNKVTVQTRKCCGAKIRCTRCGYTGQADVVEMRSRLNGRRSLERCPECKSLNIVCEELSLMDVDWEVDKWEGCYPSNWKGTIVPEAMSHPAKFSSRLIRRIYEHLFSEGWVKQGDRVLDPFGGVGLGALNAMEMGLHWTGNELEPKFVELGSGYDCPGFTKPDWVRFYGRAKRVNFTHGFHWCPECLKEMDSFAKPVAGDLFSYNGNVEIPSAAAHRFHGNIDLWNETFSDHPHWGTAVLLQGDSRKLVSSLQKSSFSGTVSSPPYKNHTDGGGLNVNKPATFRGVLKDGSLSMGDTDGNLGTMDDGNFNAAVSSPPFRHSEGGTPEPKPGGVIDERLYARHAAGNSAAEGYGAQDGQLANMPEGDFEASVSSPPYESSQQVDNRKNPSSAMSNFWEKRMNDTTFGKEGGQLGADSGDDFWLAARQIVEQVYLSLEPGGHACWVVKDFVRNKERVAFSDQWRQLCEAVGFVTVHEHRAMLVHNKGASLTLEGEVVNHRTESKSFFRRLAEKKGSPRIDFEVVWCMEKKK